LEYFRREVVEDRGGKLHQRRSHKPQVRAADALPGKKIAKKAAHQASAFASAEMGHDYNGNEQRKWAGDIGQVTLDTAAAAGDGMCRQMHFFFFWMKLS
jgi:hypothetical protein